MGEVMFYHLERQSLEDALPMLLDKCLKRGWTAVVEVPDPERLAHLDRHLWVFRDDSFLPHASEVDDPGTHQPVWLTTGEGNPSRAAVRILAGGAPVREPGRYQRTLVLFNSDDTEALADARATWKRLKTEGVPITYWQQNARGGWEKKA
ncbi:MAG: DNA polymerase III subunit chi [Pseudomonadota bacterium]